MNSQPIQNISQADLDNRFQRLIDAVVDYAIFLLDAQGRVMTWNSGAERLKGYKRDEIVGRHFSIFYPAEAIATGWPEEELRHASAEGRFEDEGWRIRKDGSRFWANVIITAIRDANGELVGFGKITRDLTERRRQEEALRISEERFRLLVDSVRDYAIFMLDPQGIVRSWNVGAQAMKGYRAGEIIGQHFSTFYTPEDQQAGKPERLLREATEKGRVEDEGWRVRKDGTLFWANLVLTAVHSATGELIGFAKITRDMTQRRRLEELERSSRRMNEFLAMLAHELRNPLAPMRNAVTLMQLEPTPSAALRSSRDIIDRQLTHVTRLVDDLLDVGRLATGKVKLRLEPVAVSEVIATSAETVRPLMQERGHTMEVRPGGEGVMVNGDPTRLSQILQNLLVNAAKYTPDGGRVVVETVRSGNFVTICVTDNGRGLEQDELDKIFGLFMQGEHSATESGLGIGLTLARSLAEMHGGTLEARSAGRGKGSTFSLRLPVTQAVGAPARKESPGLGPEGHRIMVVDDNRDSADSAAALLGLLGHEAQAAYDGMQALEAAPRFKPDFILLDISMPGMDGFTTLRRLRALPGMDRVFVVAMTGYGSTDDRRRTADAGFNGHLTKPVELSALIALLAEQDKAASPTTIG